MTKDCSECKHFDVFHTSRACHDCKPWKSSTDQMSRANGKRGRGMTREEAIEILKQYSLYSPTSQIEDALDMAIEALSADAEQEAVPTVVLVTMSDGSQYYLGHERDAIPTVSADRPQGEWKHTITWQPYCSNCEYVFDEDEAYSPLWKFCPMCGAEMADNSLFNDITESQNDVVESKDDVIKKPRTVRYKLHKPIEYVSIEFDEEEEVTQIGHYTAYGERREP